MMNAAFREIVGGTQGFCQIQFNYMDEDCTGRPAQIYRVQAGGSDGAFAGRWCTICQRIEDCFSLSQAHAGRGSFRWWLIILGC